MNKKLKKLLEEYLVDSDRMVDEYYDEFGEFIKSASKEIESLENELAGLTI